VLVAEAAGQVIADTEPSQTAAETSTRYHKTTSLVVLRPASLPLGHATTSDVVDKGTDTLVWGGGEAGGGEARRTIQGRRRGASHRALSAASYRFAVAVDTGTRAGETPSLVTAARRPSRLRRWARRLLLVVVALVALVAAGILALWPMTPSVSDLPARVRAELRAHRAEPLRVLPRPDRVGQAVIATENSRFYSDHGVDVIGLARLAADAIRGQDTGGATLEQQLAKLVYGGSWPGPLAKVQQVELALKISHSYPKPTILRLYLSAAYYGAGHYGVVDAARGYFGLSPSQLSWGQAALLAGLVQAPSVYDPYLHYGLARHREREVLDRLVDTGVLTATQARSAFAAPLQLAPAGG
jgi:hypothetical protein